MKSIAQPPFSLVPVGARYRRVGRLRRSAGQGQHLPPPESPCAAARRALGNATRAGACGLNFLVSRGSRQQHRGCSIFVLVHTRAKWSRWGWGACEGYGLEIGETFRCSVVLKPGNGPGEPASYSASINSHISGSAHGSRGRDARRREGAGEPHGGGSARLDDLPGLEGAQRRRGAAHWLPGASPPLIERWSVQLAGEQTVPGRGSLEVPPRNQYQPPATILRRTLGL